jgi:ribose-phosphate pyrophosphokinase
MKVLIVDDICDGGATFIRAARALRAIEPDVEVGLCVTHGIFSKGRQHLLDNGIDKIYTTNSLLKNDGNYEV